MNGHWLLTNTHIGYLITISFLNVLGAGPVHVAAGVMDAQALIEDGHTDGKIIVKTLKKIGQHHNSRNQMFR